MANAVNSYIPGNYFTPRTYIRSDAATGLLHTRKGNRLLAVPAGLLLGIETAIQSETGAAAPFAFYTFGFSWGSTFFERLQQEMESYYQTSLDKMNAVAFLVIMQQIWSSHGLGAITLDFFYASQGILLIQTDRCQLSSSRNTFTEAGFLAGWFSRLVGKSMRVSAIQRQETATQFVLGLAETIEPVDLWVKQGMSKENILQKLGVSL